MFSVPLHHCFSTDLAAEVPALHPLVHSLGQDDLLALVLLVFKKRCNNNDPPRDEADAIRLWHIAQLPAAYSNSIYFQDSELAYCRGTSLYTLTLRLREQIQQDYCQLCNLVFAADPEYFDAVSFSLDEYRWALCTVWSRFMDFFVPLETGAVKHIRCMVPVMDMMNAAIGGASQHRLNTLAMQVEVVAGRDYKPGDELFLDYGPISNDRLLRLYGFVFEHNPHNSFALSVSTHPQSPLFREKALAFQRLSFELDQVFLLTLEDPVPPRLLQYLRIQRASMDEISSVLSGQTREGPLSPQNELEIKYALLEAVASLLGSFAAPLDELKATLATLDRHSPAWSCVLVAIGEQEILTKTLATLESM
ncbi:hypothetical protein HDU91_005592 [Kappamyces sp. JEL0680]|nr:hypothetical protein HDU91_005592 [Kappamyces sp. JEL0680]